MPETRFLMPAPDRDVRLPGGRHVQTEGEPLELTKFVRRRVRDGDLVEPPKGAKPAGASIRKDS